MRSLIVFTLLIGFEFSFAQSTAFLPPVPPIQKPAEESSTTSETKTTTPTTVETKPETSTVETEKKLDEKMTTQMHRRLSQYTANAHFSPFSTWVPMKYGISLGYIRNDNWTFEGEYTQGSLSAGLLGVNLAQVKDSRYGIQARWYPGNANSFNLIMGLFKSEFSAEFGNQIIGNMVSTPNVTVWKLESMGPQIGLSNRWQFKYGITFGVDWFVMYLPLFNKTSDDKALTSVNNSDDRSDIDKMTSYVHNIPQFDLFKLTLGYTF